MTFNISSFGVCTDPKVKIYILIYKWSMLFYRSWNDRMSTLSPCYSIMKEYNISKTRCFPPHKEGRKEERKEGRKEGRGGCYSDGP
jgi:hypothetical protein